MGRGERERERERERESKIILLIFLVDGCLAFFKLRRENELKSLNILLMNIILRVHIRKPEETSAHARITQDIYFSILTKIVNRVIDISMHLYAVGKLILTDVSFYRL
jgi:hypothetical protein